RTRLDQAERAGAGGGRVDAAQAFGEVALDVEVAADVGAGQAELARPPQDPLQRPRGPGHQHRAVYGFKGPGLAAVPGPQPDRQVEAGLGQQGGDDLGGALGGAHGPAHIRARVSWLTSMYPARKPASE